MVYRGFEVREGFDPSDVGPLVFSSEFRVDSDAVLEALSAQGVNVQLFGIRSDGEPDGERVLLRELVGRMAA
jgi:hypothetical protein